MEIIDLPYKVVRKPIHWTTRLFLGLYVLFAAPMLLGLLAHNGAAWEYFEVLMVLGMWIGGIYLVFRVIYYIVTGR